MLRREVICFAGGGIMAQGVIPRLQAAGFSLRLYNRTPAKIAQLARAEDVVCASPAEAAGGANFIITSLGDDVAASQVWMGEDGLLSGAGGGSVAIELSTLSIGHIDNWVREVERRGLSPIDSPVTGSREGARNGTLCLFLGSDAEALTRADLLLSAFSNRRYIFGAPGAGTRFKLAYNLIGAGIGNIFAEGLAFAEAAGLSMDVALEALTNVGWGRVVACSKGRAMLNRTHTDVHYYMKWMLKDLLYALRETERLGLELPCTETSARCYEAVVRRGLGETDISAIREAITEPDESSCLQPRGGQAFDSG